jgi:hypothetical protein
MVVLLCGLVLSGCDKKAEKEVQVQDHQAVQKTEMVVVDQAKALVDGAAEQAEAVVAAGSEKLQDVAAALKQEVQEVAPVVSEKVEQVAVVAQEKATQLVVAVKQQASELQQGSGKVLNALVADDVPTPIAVSSAPDGASAQASDMATKVVAVAATVVVPPVTEVAGVSVTIVIKNTKANVTLTHAVHGEKYGCAVCHGDGIPGPFELGKTTAHKLCKDCHKDKGGPTNCAGCHVK